MTVYVPTEIEAAIWEKIKAPIEQAWLDEMKAQGVTIAPDLLKDLKNSSSESLGSGKKVVTINLRIKCSG